MKDEWISPFQEKLGDYELDIPVPAARGRKLLFPVIAAVAAGIFYYRNNKDDVDRAVRKAGKQVSSKAEGAKKSIQKGIPTSSSYKREKEGLVK